MQTEQKEYEHEHIIICSQCKGEAIIEVFDPADILNIGESKIINCTSCNGSGRLIRSAETIIKIRPFKNNQNEK